MSGWRWAGLSAGIVLFLLGAIMAAVPPHWYPNPVQHWLDTTPMVAPADVLRTRSEEWKADHPVFRARLMVGRWKETRRRSYAALTDPTTRGETGNVAYRLECRLMLVGAGVVCLGIGILLICLSCCCGRDHKERCRCERVAGDDQAPTHLRHSATSLTAVSGSATDSQPNEPQMTSDPETESDRPDPTVQPTTPKPATMPVAEEPVEDVGIPEVERDVILDEPMAWWIRAEIRQVNGRIKIFEALGTSSTEAKITVGDDIEASVTPRVQTEV